MRVVPIPCLSDNYAYLLVCPETKEAAIVDPSEPEPVLRALETGGDGGGRENVKVTAIFATHHHYDHVGGIEVVKEKLAIERVYGHASDKGRIPAQTELLEEGQTFTLGSLLVRVLHIPGHTTGAIAYVVTREPNDPIVFTGDTLFLSGCGRLFEGDPPMMQASLSKLAKLDPRTKVYCGHEYTEANLRFAAHCEPSNGAIEKAKARAAALRKESRPTVPATIGDELGYNPFLRVRSAEIRKTLGIADDASDADALGAIRKAKDGFK
ncbi:MAG: hydroxyacylglutathione hydrolase [Deltaproteobacteria bacterium]|nr:hydroxyacylglutathione hydrolase [Deltaproteobacteria bacterium]